ncbi:MAG: hypothetical protein LAO04_21950 [Acidobacteriia bacterium]|nr:hypothetical protein [Terriglobia bacterium]
MTIAAGFVAADGILLCADTLWTDGYTKEYRDKIFSWTGRYAAACFAVAGNSANARDVVEACRDALSATQRKRLAVQDILRLIKPIIKTSYESSVDARPYEERDDARFSLLVGVAAGKQVPQLFASTRTVLAPVDTFDCVGAGRHLARYVVQPSYRNNLTVDELAVLGILALAATKQHVDGVGGKSQFVVIGQGFVSGIVPYDVNQSEPLALEHQRRATDLLLTIADATLDAESFRNMVRRFTNYLQDARSEWSKHGAPHRELRDALRQQATNR